MSCYSLYFRALNGKNERIDKSDKDKAQELLKLPHVLFPYALSNPHTVMVKSIHTSFTYFTVLGPVLDWHFAVVAVSVKAHILEGFLTILSFSRIGIRIGLTFMRALRLRFLKLGRVIFELVIAFEL